MASRIKRFFKRFIELLTPSDVGCVNCGREIFEGSLCEDCAKDFYKNDNKRCIRCSRPTISVDDVVCEQCKEMGETYFDRAYSPLVYTGVALSLIRKFKYHERRDVGGFLSAYMVDEARGIPPFDFIICVPMWRGKYNERLYSTAEELAKEVSIGLGVEYVDGVVEKTKDTLSQTEFGGRERLDNVKGSFRVKRRALVKGKSILVVDDVFTTGATANEVARVLKGAKAEKVYVLTSAIAVKR